MAAVSALHLCPLQSPASKSSAATTTAPATPGSAGSNAMSLGSPGTPLPQDSPASGVSASASTRTRSGGLSSHASSRRSSLAAKSATKSAAVVPPWGVPAPAVVIDRGVGFVESPRTPRAPQSPSPHRRVFRGGRSMADWKLHAPVGKPHTWRPMASTRLVSPNLVSRGVADAMNHPGQPPVVKQADSIGFGHAKFAPVLEQQKSLFGVALGATKHPVSAAGTSLDSNHMLSVLDESKAGTERHRAGEWLPSCKKHVEYQPKSPRTRGKRPTDPPTMREEPTRGLRRVGHNAYWHQSTQEAQLGPQWKSLRRKPEPPSRGHRPWSTAEPHVPRKITAPHLASSRPLWDPEPVPVRPRKTGVPLHLRRTALWGDAPSDAGSSQKASDSRPPAPWCQRPFS